MCAGVANDAFQLRGGIDQLAQVRCFLVDLSETGLSLDGFRDGDRLPGDVGDHLCHAIHVDQWNVKHSADIPDRGAGTERPEGDDLGYFIAAIFLCRVLEHPVAQVVLEVEVNIGH